MSHRLKEHIKQSAPFESDAQEALINLFVASSYMRQQIEQACSAKGISFNHYNILRILRGASESGYARSEIINRMIDRASDVTRLIDRMVKIGIVSRLRSDQDRRVSLHTITKKGRDLLDELSFDIKGIQKMFESRIERHDLLHLSRICEGVYLGEE